ncbi:MAG: hypothetical protein ACSHW4_06885 [Cellulophaga sp.]|uniref:hypothetical protein n=1 Tax=unclassified Cellulophaga TaxID=2634405 RepID=UPI0026E2BC72|nr:MULTISPECIES: hypothetical protein [unclassified Cellulophaga]MDO6492836.1 hypothetical protein [Cellulophaga sp. 2_MG-2023]MDO6496338.1 hypothetical protein [Cellulophaga sp. 3_MG-2023]
MKNYYFGLVVLLVVFSSCQEKEIDQVDINLSAKERINLKVEDLFYRASNSTELEKYKEYVKNDKLTKEQAYTFLGFSTEESFLQFSSELKADLKEYSYDSGLNMKEIEMELVADYSQNQNASKSKFWCMELCDLRGLRDSIQATAMFVGNPYVALIFLVNSAINNADCKPNCLK